MAYFSSGSEGMDYQEAYCLHCRNWRKDESHDVPGCPIWDLHLGLNYDQEKHIESANTIKEILDILIPMNADKITPGQCSMFLPFENPDVPGQMKMRFEK